MEITFRKTRTSFATDWLFIGDLECIAEPIVARSVVSANIRGPNNQFADPTAALGTPDGTPVSLGPHGQLTLDLGWPRKDGEGNDLLIHEALESPSGSAGALFAGVAPDTLPESYNVYGSPDSSSWVFLGQASGTAGFDLATVDENLQFCGVRFVRIVDSGAGDSTSASPGVDIDGVSTLDSLPVPPYVTTELQTGIAIVESGSVAWRPDGAGLYVPYRTLGDSVQRIAFLPAQGGQLVDLGIWGVEPAISPDGTRIAYCGRSPNAPNSGPLIVRTFASAENDTLSSDACCPSWAGNSEVLFGGSGGAYRVAVSGGAAQLVLPLAGTNGQFAWSPERDRLVYTQYAEIGDSLHCGSLSIAAPQVSQLVVRSYPAGTLEGTISLGPSTESAAWSHDGTFLVCSSRNGLSNRDLFLVQAYNLDRHERLTIGDRVDSSPTWSPTGASITFSGKSGGTAGLFRLPDLSRAVVAVPGSANLGGAELRLDQNVPNPFRATTSIRFAIMHPGHIRLSIYDIAGRLRRRLVDRRLDPGSHAIVWDGSDSDGRMMSPGVYWYRISVNGTQASRRLAIVH